MSINTFFDFCSGIGGGRIGLEQAKLSCVGHSDTSRLYWIDNVTRISKRLAHSVGLFFYNYMY